jgi:hypothetical protein
MKPGQIVSTVLLVLLGSFSAVALQKAPGDSEPPKPKPRRPPEIEAIVDQAQVAPPEFAAAALIRIGQSSKVAKHAERKSALLQDAFLLASKAQQPQLLDIPQLGLT